MPETASAHSAATLRRLSAAQALSVEKARAVLEHLVPAGLFLTLPVERIVTVEVAGFTVRPVFFFMALFVAMHASDLAGGARAMSTSALIAVAVLFSHAGTYDLSGSLAYAAWALFTLMFALVAVGHLSKDRERLAHWIWLYVVSASLWAGVAIVQWFLAFANADLAYSWLGSLPRLHALSYEPSFFGFYIVAPLALALATDRFVWAVPIVVAATLATSRAAVLGALVGAAVLAVAGTSRDRRRLGAAVGAVGAAALALAIPPAVDHRPVGTVDGATPPAQSTSTSAATTRPPDQYADFVTFDDSASVHPRLQSWQEALDLFAEHPVNGVGLNAFEAARVAAGAPPPQPGQDLKTTNLWLETGAEMGIVGVVALLIWAFLPVPFLWRARRSLALATPLLAALLGSAAMFAFVQTWWVPYRWMPWILAYALVGPTLAALLTGAGRARGQPRRARPG